MASPSSGRYQSRLFNWLSQGFSQIEKLQPHIRRLKIGVTWGVEVVFFSAYRLSQLVRFPGQRLGQAAQQPLSVNTASSSQAIQEILTEVQESKYGQLAPFSPADLEATDPVTFSPGKVAAPVLIQGIATLLESRTLVLVNEQNQLLDILTPAQQKRLYRRIAQKISGDGPWGRMTQSAQQHLSSRFQTTLGRMLAWMPRGIAQPIITRLKAQSVTGQLQESFPTSSGLVISPKSKIGQALSFLDSVSLRLEQGVGQIIHPTQQGLGHQSQTSMPDQTASKTHEPGIRGLIRAAIAYFFNHKPQRFFSRSTSTQFASLNSDNSVATTSSSQQLSQGSNQPLITESTESRPNRAFSVAVQPPRKIRPARRTKPEQESTWLTMADLFGGSAKASLASDTSGVAAVSLTSQAPTGRFATRARVDSDSIVLTNSDTQAVSQGSDSRAHGNQVDIETEAILMEYVKHPLEQALEWLDRSLAWLEEMLIVLWSHLQPYWAAVVQLIRRSWQR